jgi:hypothetical protein
MDSNTLKISNAYIHKFIFNLLEYYTPLKRETARVSVVAYSDESILETTGPFIVLRMLDDTISSLLFIIPNCRALTSAASPIQSGSRSVGRIAVNIVLSL